MSYRLISRIVELASFKAAASLLAALVGLTLSACSVDGAAVGKGCQSNADCSDLDDGTCTAHGICTRACQVHQDCGCNVDGVTTDDIAAGKCDTSCDMSARSCMRLCKVDKDCPGTALCRIVDDYPYKTCW